MVHLQKDMMCESREAMRGGEGVVQFMHMEKENLPKNGRVFAKLTLAPAASIGKHIHTGETEMFYFLQGSGVVMDDDTPVTVQAGDSMTTSSGHAHGVENTGNVDLELIAVIIKD